MKWPLKIHVQRTSEFKYHFLFYCLYILYIQTLSRSRHNFEIARIRDMRAHLYLTRDNLIFVHAIFLPRATLCAFISIACVHKILTVYSIMSTHLNYLNYNKIYSHANKKYMSAFLLYSSCFLESSCILQNLVVVYVAT